LTASTDTLRTVALSMLIFAATGSLLLAAMTYGVAFLPQAIGGRRDHRMPSGGRSGDPDAAAQPGPVLFGTVAEITSPGAATALAAAAIIIITALCLLPALRK
jgi:hypothetical protein